MIVWKDFVEQWEPSYSSQQLWILVLQSFHEKLFDGRFQTLLHNKLPWDYPNAYIGAPKSIIYPLCGVLQGTLMQQRSTFDKLCEMFSKKLSEEV